MDGFFHQYLAVIRGLSDKTILAYRDAVKLLLCFAADHLKRDVDELTIEDIGEGLVLAFLDHVEKKRRCSVRTRNARFAAISTFFNFIGRQQPSLLSQCQAVRTIPRKRDEHRSIDYLDAAEVQAIMDGIDPMSRTGLRDKALLLFLFNTGARVQECVDLSVGNLRLDSQGQVKLLGKGRKERACPLWPETVEAIRTYRSHGRMPESSEQRVFLNANRKPMTRFGIRYIVRTQADRAAQKCASLRKKTIGPHTWRHSTAMHLLQAGNDINMVSYWLGHANINTTHVYVEIDMEMKRKMLAQCSPPKSKAARRQWQKPKTIQWLDALSRRTELCAVKS
jgi:site-specific recombinase XerD